MRWKDQERSENVEDDRGNSAGPALAVGGGIGTLVIMVIAVLLGADPRQLMQQLPQNAPPGAGAGPGAGPGEGGRPNADRPVDPAEEEAKDFVSVVLRTTEDVWAEQFKQMGKTYEKPKLKLFTGNVNTEGCGFASAAVGPFYCPADSRVYLDLSFFQELKRRFKSPGEFAQAYVVAHEIGHHIQNLLGISAKIDGLRRRASKEEASALSVRLELQADFLAGVWAYHVQKTKRLLEPGDIESGLRAAKAIGDDNIQMEAQGYVRPDTFTHGSSEQRVRWFRKGFETGDINQGDTFNTDKL